MIGKRLMTACSAACAVALAATGLLSVTAAGAAMKRAAPGVSKDEIEIVALVSDLDGLRSKGVNLPPKLTTAGQLKQWQLYADAMGPINGRKVVYKPVVFDTTDPTSFDRACVEATQDNKPFVVVNAAGYRPVGVPCITVDNKTPLFVQDPQDSKTIKQSGDRLWTVLPPSDVIAGATASVIAKQKLVPKDAKIGLLTTNDPGGVAAGDALEQGLEKAGYNVVDRVVINALAADADLSNREATTAVQTFKDEGIDTVFTGVQQSQLVGFWQESAKSNAGFKAYIIDDAPNMCTLFSASRNPAETEGVPCLTSSDTRALPTKDGVKPDSKFEAGCRKTSDAALGEKSQPGVPGGDVTANGVTYTQDMPYITCTMSNILLPAIKAAGKNPTWDKVVKQLESTKSVPMAYYSDGKGSFGKSKHYAADKVHLVAMNRATTTTEKDAATGTFNGCPAPTSCWIPQLISGQEWFALPTTG
jgi:hypothetical protein